MYYTNLIVVKQVLRASFRSESDFLAGKKRLTAFNLQAIWQTRHGGSFLAFELFRTSLLEKENILKY